jgi:hypothetical protein
MGVFQTNGSFIHFWLLFDCTTPHDYDSGWFCDVMGFPRPSGPPPPRGCVTVALTSRHGRHVASDMGLCGFIRQAQDMVYYD